MIILLKQLKLIKIEKKIQLSKYYLIVLYTIIVKINYYHIIEHRRIKPPIVH